MGLSSFLAFFNQNHRTFPVQVVESKEEIKSRHDRIAFCLYQATGVDITDEEASKKEKFLILYNQPQAFFCSDLASELGWERFQNALVLVDKNHSEKEIFEKIECFSPDFIFLANSEPSLTPAAIPPGVKGVFTFRSGHPKLAQKTTFETYDIYTLDEFPFVGIKKPQEDFYRYNPWCTYLEKTPYHRLAFTSLDWDNMAWIRYATYDLVEEVNEFAFRIRSLGHW